MVLRMSYFKTKIVVVSLLLLLLTLPVAAQEPIKIGLITPLTGPVSTYGISVRNSVVMGVDQINAQGGIKGHPIHLIVLDDKGDATEAAQVARRLIDREKVSLIIGPVITPAVMAVAPICQAQGIPMITPTGTGDLITTLGDYIFRAAYKDSFQGSLMAQFAIESLGIKEAAIIYDIANDYSVGLRAAFKETFQRLGGKIVTEESYSTGDTDFSAQLTSLSMRNLKALFIPDYYSAAGPILMQARQMGMDAVMLGVDGWDSPELHLLAGGFEEGGYIINHYSTEDQSPTTQQYIKDYQATYGYTPDALAALGYDAILIVKEVLETVEFISAENIKHALGSVKNIEAATGTIDMDPEGTPVKSAVVLQMKDGQWQLVDKVEPTGR